MHTKTLIKKRSFIISPSTKGQVVIPKEIRDYFQINQNSKLSFSFDEKKVYIEKKDDDVEGTFGSLGKKLKTQVKKPLTQKQFEDYLEEAKDLYFKAKYD